MKKIKEFYQKYRVYISNDLIMYLIMIAFIILSVVGISLYDS